jgi:hypothetical protein
MYTFVKVIIAYTFLQLNEIRPKLELLLGNTLMYFMVTLEE